MTLAVAFYLFTISLTYIKRIAFFSFFNIFFKYLIHFAVSSRHPARANIRCFFNDPVALRPTRLPLSPANALTITREPERPVRCAINKKATRFFDNFTVRRASKRLTRREEAARDERLFRSFGAPLNKRRKIYAARSDIVNNRIGYYLFFTMAPLYDRKALA